MEPEPETVSLLKPPPHPPLLVQRFSPNPYFENREVWKSYSYSDIGTLTLSSPPLQWKPGKVRAPPRRIQQTACRGGQERTTEAGGENTD